MSPTNLLKQGATWLERKRTEYLTGTVTYQRGDVAIDVAATIGRTQYETNDGQVVQVQYTERDFLILTDDLFLRGERALPERGDLIHDDTVVFEVLDWRYSDPYRMTYRITTKSVA